MRADVLIVGGGAAGLEVAVAVRRRSPAASATLVSEEPDQVYRPWLIFLPWHRVPEEALRISLAGAARRQGFTFVAGRVDQVDPDAGTAIVCGEPMDYRYIVIAAGAPADRGRIAGATSHALFTCELGDARRLAHRLAEPDVRAVTFVLSGERVGPGLESAAWTARGAQEAGRRLRVNVVSDGDAVVSFLGERGALRYARALRHFGGEVMLTAAVEAIEPDGVRLDHGRRVTSDIAAVVGPLSGPGLEIRGDATDHAGYVIVDGCLRSPRHPRLFAAGDAATCPGQAWRRSWLLSVRQAETVAANVAAALAGETLQAFNPAIGRRLARTSVPDVGGSAMLVVNRRLIASGQLVDRLRVRMDRLHFARYLPDGAAAVRPH